MALNCNSYVHANLKNNIEPTAHVSSLPSHPVLAPGSMHCHLQTSVFAWATRSCGSPSVCASEHPSCGLTVASAGQKSHRMATTVLLAVAVLANISAMLSPMTSSSEPSGLWTCTLSWSRHAFCAAMESVPMEQPSILGSTVNILFGTLRVRIRLTSPQPVLSGDRVSCICGQVPQAVQVRQVVGLGELPICANRD